MWFLCIVYVVTCILGFLCYITYTCTHHLSAATENMYVMQSGDNQATGWALASNTGEWEAQLETASLADFLIQLIDNHFQYQLSTQCTRRS